MSEEQKICEFMKRSQFFIQQPDTHFKRWHFIKNGKQCGYVWFKYALGGWSLTLSDYEGVMHIDSVKTLKICCGIDKIRTNFFKNLIIKLLAKSKIK